MRGRRPEVVVTDMDSGLRDALAIEMPDTKQIICIRQILSRMSSWFSLQLGLRYSEFKSKFDALCHLENVEDFEHRWNHLVAQFGIVSDKHISLLFSYRTSWPLCYVRNFFLARTVTREYSKSVEKFVKNVVSVQSSLHCFYKQVAIAAKSGTEKREEVFYLPIKTCMPLEEHARSVLTPFAFSALQNEIVLSMQYSITEMGNDSFLARHFKKMERECLVIWIPGGEQVHCSCKEFEHSGVLCRHSLRLLVLKNYFEIPEKYFLFRWRMDDRTITNCKDECSRDFHSLSATLFTESFLSKERFSFVRGELAQLVERVQNMPVSDPSISTNKHCLLSLDS